MGRWVGERGSRLAPRLGDRRVLHGEYGERPQALVPSPRAIRFALSTLLWPKGAPPRRKGRLQLLKGDADPLEGYRRCSEGVKARGIAAIPRDPANRVRVITVCICCRIA